MELAAVCKYLNSLAPTSLGEKWDNVGLLVEPYTKTSINNILLTNDLTEQVFEEAVEQKCQLIISYHPPIFEAWKQLSPKNVKQRIILRAIESRIAIYSPHTAFDAVGGGINDWLASGLGDTDSVKPLKVADVPSAGIRMLVRVPLGEEQAFLQGLRDLKFFGSLETKSDSLASIAFVVPKGRVNDFTDAVRKKDCNIYTFNLVGHPDTAIGSGRLATLKEPATFAAMIERVKKHLHLKHLRAAQPSTGVPLVKTIAICAGSGASVLKGVKADLYLTGELAHHDVHAAIAQGTGVLLTEHSNCERGYLRVLKHKLDAQFAGQVHVHISARDADPLEVV